MKNTKKCLLIICLSLILSLAGCSKSNDKAGTSSDLQGKVKTEISYLNTELIEMMNKLNNISFANYMVEAREVSYNNESSSGGTESSARGECWE